MQGFDDRFQAESGWKAWNLPLPNVQ